MHKAESIKIREHAIDDSSFFVLDHLNLVQLTYYE